MGHIPSPPEPPHRAPVTRVIRATGVLALALSSLAAAATLSSCARDPRELTWVVLFAPDAEPSRAARVETRIISGGCEGTTDLYLANITPGSPTALAPGTLPPGTYGFAATAVDDACVPYATTCGEAALPLPEGGGVAITLTRDPLARPACRTDECRASYCNADPLDGGIADADASGDGSADGGDGGAPARPIVVAQGSVASGAVDIVAPTSAFLVAAGMNMHRQTGGGGGYIGSAFDMESAPRAGTVVERVGAMGTDLYGNSALIALDLGLGAEVEHSSFSSGYDLTSERWAWAALAADSVWAGEDHGTGASAGTTGIAPEEVVALVHVASDATTTDADARLSLTAEVDGTACAAATLLGVGAANPPTAAASFFCIVALGPGSHEFDATVTGPGLAETETHLSYILAPRADVPLFGNSSETSAALRLPSAGVLVAFAAARFTETGPGWGDIAVRIDGSDCGRVRSAGTPTALTATCLWPATTGGWVTVSADGTSEGGVTVTGTTLGWAFFASE